MVAAEIAEEVANRRDLPEEELADGVYDLVKTALDRGESRDAVYATLEMVYAQLTGPENEKQRRAVREVMGCFHGDCAPSVAL
jgi:hypothetical protein